MALSYNQLAARRLDRISALSDGLFAIAMTLIVLEIRLPDAAGIHSEQDLWGALLNLSPRLVTYLLSFLALGIFLAGIALMPFSTSVLAEFTARCSTSPGYTRAAPGS